VGGHPSLLAWDRFHLEIAKRLMAGKIPEKQDAFVAEMHEWCRTTLGVKPGESTLKQRIKPYYDTFVRKVRNPS
jgi:hypothetical protein